MTPDPILRDRKSVISWLIVCLIFISLMVLAGGYTRLSGSGLSITEWKPIHGVIPPLGETQWEEEFNAYKQTPQYSLINKDMTLSGFKEIFWPEYLHRVLGRLTGAVFLLPLIVFALRKSIEPKMLVRLTAILALGGLQGLIGWIMVKSGLQDGPYVNHLKLALHLSMAFTLYALILWVLLGIVDNKNFSVTRKRAYMVSYKLWFTLLCIQIIFGAFMAGLHAGLIYNTWPTMNGEYIPSELMNLSIYNTQLLENRTFINFIHRTVAIALILGYIIWCCKYVDYLKTNNLSTICTLLIITIFIQLGLGVYTLIYQVPLDLALLHQMTALLLWTLAVCLLYRITNIKVF